MAVERTGPLSVRLVQANARPMTLDGTNSYLLGAPDSASAVVVDPGELGFDEHLDALASGRQVELILLTHRHRDHAESAPELARRTGAPVRALRPELCVAAPPLRDGEAVEAAGARIEVIATPGHTSDSACFRLPGDGPHASVLTGDTILGRGTTTIGPEPGALRDYLTSLERLRGLGAATVLPAHGDPLPSLTAICDDYLAHRRTRLVEVRAALDAIGRDASAEEVADVVYAEVDPAIRPAALASVRAQLEFLREDG